MFVHALLLRRHGIPIAEEGLRDIKPLFGRLQYSGASDNLLLMPLDAEKTDPLVQLFKCKLKVIERRGMVYVGTEDIWKRKARESYPQALWCWPPTGDFVFTRAPVRGSPILAPA